MKGKQREELLEILKLLLEEELAWFEVRTPAAYIRIGSGPEASGQPAPGPSGDGRALPTYGPAAPPPNRSATAVRVPHGLAPVGSDAPLATTARPETRAPSSPNQHVVSAPFAGVFYRRPSPAEPPFVEVGTAIRAADTVCLVEVMKLFNSVHAGVDGIVAAIEAADGEVVEYGQALIRIAPSDPTA